ncbi:MAG: T9SS type A sorting domain-containing protein [Muribaculaceae bacterium]|nr:T9SS type A sorting domain-containing protein [Muribaculaceae bacterium]MDE6320808.1 T9SS type A sorting domain-containing protein [Muribaculaceae bacterium]
MQRLITTLAILLISAIGWNAKAWEETDRVPASADRTQVDNDGPEIVVSDGWIYVNTTRPITIKIYSILGQLISQDSLPAGTFRLHVASRGIYILKAGAITRRITI